MNALSCDIDKIYVTTASATWELCRSLVPTDIYTMDDNQKFFKETLAYSPKAIREDLLNAITFFKKKFGIDFCGQIQSSPNVWSIVGATLTSYSLNLCPELVVMNTGKTTGRVSEGGWMVVIQEPGYLGMMNDQQTFYKPGTVFLFGFSKIFFPDASCKTFHYRSMDAIPIFPAKITLNHPLNFETYDLDTRKWGTSLGLLTLYTLTNNIYKLEYRLVTNFNLTTC